MPEYQLVTSPEIGFNESNLYHYLEQKGLLAENQHVHIIRRSIDARQRNIKINLLIDVSDSPYEVDYVEYFKQDHHVENAPEVIIVGAGPAGLFAALKAIESGLKPIVLERGKDVQSRRRDLAAINKKHIVNPDSNYCFGEGGAGTYSDGKLYTRSKKRGSVRRIFEILVAHGATPDILFEAHPHIGTNKLPKIITAIRETIEQAGGEVRFNAKVNGFLIKNGEVSGVKLQNGDQLTGVATLLATGHSARDIFTVCQQSNIKIEAKSFALGVRIEHPQPIIDQIQYHHNDRGYLPAAAYSLVTQTKFNQTERGVFSFCMCPGGFIVPAATAPGEVVVNGMSPSRRDSKYANSGIVVAIEPEDLLAYKTHGELAHLQFQSAIEQKAWELGGKTQCAPAQRLVDFVDGKVSNSLNNTSYQPGLASTDLSEVLPDFLLLRLRQGLKRFGGKMKGYFTNEAQIVGVESRTSSPVRIPRDTETLEHIEVKRLFPCGEGAGYAGGIASAAIDGERCMEQIVRKYGKAKALSTWI